ncbi:hypothetical protein HKX69_07940 [Streptomyces argyrophyllae]|uniref:Uncharacterized protein n=1 Tax=Streptomyces argyrophylli TaxID=2726118 RepID=A0A6M4PIL2_9ACTN|nr:hypothetical protein [Streptomyces argyrophyllae]QJS09456.1 hypothetical protein HKX69_07940 [Streptomyces argyrophyllae]
MPLTDRRARWRAWAPAALGLLALVTVSCDTGVGRPPSAARPTAPARSAAYDAGWRTGREILDSGGKGAAVREVVWGGCVRRSLTARPREVVERDRGAWVLGCRHGVSGARHRRPARPLTRRETDPGLLAGFRSWAARHGRKAAAAGASRVVLVHLGDHDYDVELTASHDRGDRAVDAADLADAFAEWWDGDDGDAGVAWNLLVLTRDGERLVTRDL